MHFAEFHLFFRNKSIQVSLEFFYADYTSNFLRLRDLRQLKFQIIL